MSYKFDEKIICPWDITASKKRIQQYREYYKIKFEIVREASPKRIIEIGIRAGYSAYFFLQACPKAMYYGFDADNGTHGGQGPKSYLPWAKKILDGYYFQLIYPFDTQQVSSLPVVGDFYHIDGDHSEIGVYHDLSMCFSGAISPATILIDDYDYLASVRSGVDKWLSDFAANYEYRKSLRGEIIVRK